MAMGTAASTATSMPQTIPGMPNMPHTEVTANAAQKKKKPNATIRFLPWRLASMFTGA